MRHGDEERRSAAAKPVELDHREGSSPGAKR
jgi:hypothetical protein